MPKNGTFARNSGNPLLSLWRLKHQVNWLVLSSELVSFMLHVAVSQFLGRQVIGSQVWFGLVQLCWIRFKADSVKYSVQKQILMRLNIINTSPTTTNVSYHSIGLVSGSQYWTGIRITALDWYQAKNSEIERRRFFLLCSKMTKGHILSPYAYMTPPFTHIHCIC